MRKCQWEMGNARTLKQTKRGTNQNLFARRQHPTLEIPKPEVSRGMVAYNLRNSIGKFIQWNNGQIECTRRFLPPKHVDGEHCLLLTGFRKSRQSRSP
jgi:hypothetical protein